MDELDLAAAVSGPGVRSPIVAVTALPGAGSATAHGAALAIALAGSGERGVILLEAGRRPPRRPTMLSSRPARALEVDLRGRLPAAARGTLCWAGARTDDWHEAIERCLAAGPDALVVVLDPAEWRELIDMEPSGPTAALVVAELPRQRALAALVARELIGRGLRAAVVGRAPGAVPARRAGAGIEPGGELAARSRRLARRLIGGRAPERQHRSTRVGGEAGQALPLVLALALALAAAGAALALLGAAATGAVRLQRAADLAAVSAARSLRDDHARLFVPARLPGGAPNPRHLSEREYRARAVRAAERAAALNDAGDAIVATAFPGTGFAPTRVRVQLEGTAAAGEHEGEPVSVGAVAEAYPVAPAAGAESATRASGGGYSGMLLGRQGERMRPDVARAFDRLAAAARQAGHSLVVNSAFRSDAEQATLFAANPDPRWVAPPGASLHRCATELDLGPASAYAWLAGNAGRFGFVRRYSWEPWHFGYTAGPPPCSAAGDRIAEGGGDGRAAASALPSFVPPRFRSAVSTAALRSNVSAALLAAQLMAESNFNPFAVSPAGARGIAQFMPATAAAYGLVDPFDARAAIAAQARLMSALLIQFGGSVELALAAYNAGPAAVAACGCVPPYPETQAYVVRVLGLMGGAGTLPPPELEVRLVA